MTTCFNLESKVLKIRSEFLSKGLWNLIGSYGCFTFSAVTHLTKSFPTTALFFLVYITNVLCHSEHLPSPHPTTNASVTNSTYYPLALLLSGDLFASVPIFVGSVFSSPCLNVTPSSKTMQAGGERENERVNVGAMGDAEVGRGR